MIDIIIPVYNAYEELCRCVDSVMKYTDIEKNRIIFVNDCSSDERVAPYLNSLVSNHVLVHHNKVNQGFSANVNYGITQSEENDVLLLNTDTIVTRGWLEKIAACAARDPQIASVTPLSNRAEICSVPNYLEPNEVPDEYTVDSFAELVERCSLHLYPQIPVAIGYCMFIPRRVIQKVGLFDAATYQRGYGEENDFCNRAILLGFYNVMCDDTFIYHSGCASFREARTELCLQHEKILRTKYPDIMHQLDVYLRENPNRVVQENIKLHLALEQGRRNILMFSHRDFRKGAHDSVGGVQLHLADLVRNLRSNFNVIVVARDSDLLSVTAYGRNHQYQWQTYLGEQAQTPILRDANLHALYKKLLELFQIDLVHVHHVIGMSHEVFYAAGELNIPLVTTLHDYYYACPTIRCIRLDGTFCGVCDNTVACADCLSSQTILGFNVSAVPNYQENWREVCSKELLACNALVAPSKNVRDNYLRLYPQCKERFTVIAHGVDTQGEKSFSGYISQKLRVAFVGGISYEKGSRVAVGLVNRMPDVEFFLIGTTGDQELTNTKADNLHMLGPYTRESLPGILKRHRVDLVCIPSIWPETFCYTAAEAVACGLPVLCFNLGAQGERIRENNLGWAIPLEDGVEGLVNQLRLLQQQPELYIEARRACCEQPTYTTRDMSDRYRELYYSLLSDRPGQKHYDFTSLFSGQGSDAQGISAAAARVEELTAKLKEIETAPSYQIMLKVRKNLPFKEKLKSLMGLEK